MSLNKILLIGQVGRDCTALGQSGKAAKFSVAYTDRYTNQKTGETKETTTWFDVIVFNQVDSAIDNIRKGCKVFVEGEISLNKFTGSEGVERTSIQIKAFEWRLLAPPRGQQAGQAPARREAPARNAGATGAGHVDPAEKGGHELDDFEDSGIPF